MARGGLVALIATPLLVRQGLDTWAGDSLLSLDLQSKTLLCELLDRPRMMGRLTGVRSLSWVHLERVESSYCTTHGLLDASLDASFNFRCATVCRCL